MYLEKRGAGSWRLTISDGYNKDGSKKRLSRTIKVDPNKTERAQRREAEQIAHQICAAYNSKEIVTGKKITVNELAERYLKNKRNLKKLKPQTVDGYEHLIRGRILPALGDKYVQDLTRVDIERFYLSLGDEKPKTRRGKGDSISGTSQRHYHIQVKALMNYAISQGIITVNPCNGVDAPKTDTEETKWLEMNDVAKLLDVLDNLDDPQWRCFFLLALYTASRPGELVGLNWSDISGDTMRIQAGATHIKGKGTVRTEAPKTKRSVRTLTIPAPALEALNRHRMTQLEYRLQFGKEWLEPDAVFTTDVGGRMNISSPTHKFQKILRANNLPHITLYGLRHTAASTLIATGASPRDVAAQLGHAQTSTTMNIYAHAFEGVNRKNADALSNAYNAARKHAK